MKFISTKQIALVMILTLPLSSVAGEWLGEGKISSIQSEIFRETDEGGKPTIVVTNITSSNCGGKTWVLRSNIDGAEEIYSALLTAYTTYKDVSLYEWSCIKLGNQYYPRIGGIKIH